MKSVLMKSSSWLVVLMLGAAGAGTVANAFEVKASSVQMLSKEYHQIKEVRVQEIGEAEESELTFAQLKDEGKDEGSVEDTVILLERIVNLGKQLWKIVEAGKPVVNVTTATASALPVGVNDWRELGGWRFAKGKVYSVSYRNYFNMKVVEFVFRVNYAYGGNVGGEGQYLADMTIEPVKVRVAPMFKLNADVAIPEVHNSGTKANPVAGARIAVRWKVDSMLAAIRESMDFEILGDGTLERLH